MFHNWALRSDEDADDCGYLGWGLKAAADCPACGHHCGFESTSCYVIWPTDQQMNIAPPIGEFAAVTVWKCLACEAAVTTLARWEAADVQSRPPVEVRAVWPEVPPRELSALVPEMMRSLFREASVAAAAGALRGAAALYRAAVEAMLDDLGVAEGNLYKRITALGHEKGLDSDLIEDLHEARLLGNNSLHEGIVFDAAEIDDVADLITDAAEVLYVEPARRREMRERRAKRRAEVGH